MEGIHTPKLQFMQAAMLVSVRKNSFTERVVKYWNRLLGEVVESPFLEVFNEPHGSGTYLYGLVFMVVKGWT